MNSELNKQVAPALKSTEKVIWCGQPKIKLFSLLDLFIIPFTCIWTSMPLLGSIKGWTKFAMQHKQGENLFMLLWLTMFAVFGLYITVGRFIHEYFRRRARYFIVTNERVIVFSKFWPQVIHSRELNKLKKIIVMQAVRNSKAGTISFEQLSVQDRLKQATSIAPRGYGSQKELIFYDLDDVNVVLTAIKQQCKDGQLQIEKIDPVSLPSMIKRISKLDVKELQRMQKEVPTEELIEGEKFTPNIISHLPKSEANELIRTHRRLYIGRSFGMLAGVFCALIFGYSALATYAERSQAVLHSKAWPMTQGKIEELEIITSKRSPYLRTIRINFEVNGKNYACEKYSYDDRSDRIKDAEYQFALSHKIGDSVDVFYDPQDPEKNVITRSAVISHSQEDTGKIFITIGLLVLVVVLFRLFILRFKTFEAKPLKSESFGGEIFRCAFLSVWACMFFGGMLSMSAGPIMRSIAHLRTIP